MAGPKARRFESTRDTTTLIFLSGLKIVLLGHDQGQDESCESLRFSAILPVSSPFLMTFQQPTVVSVLIPDSSHTRPLPRRNAFLWLSARRTCAHAKVVTFSCPNPTSESLWRLSEAVRGVG